MCAFVARFCFSIHSQEIDIRKVSKMTYVVSSGTCNLSSFKQPDISEDSIMTCSSCGASLTMTLLQICSVVTVSKCFLSVGFGRFCRKKHCFRFGLGFHDKCVVNFFMTRVIWHDFHHH